jgi:hypothetical protein
MLQGSSYGWEYNSYNTINADGITRIIYIKHNRILKSKIMVRKIGSEHKY